MSLDSVQTQESSVSSRHSHPRGWHSVELRDDGDARFFRPDGRPFPDAPPAPRWAGPSLEPTRSHLEAAGITIGADTATPDWHGERLDVGFAIDVLRPPESNVAPGRNVPAGTYAEIPPGRVLDTRDGGLMVQLE